MQIKIYDDVEDFEVDTICLSSYDIDNDEDRNIIMETIRDIISGYEDISVD